jgi:hypothetical protein
LATVGPAVTVVVPVSGRVLISVTAGIETSNNNGSGFMSFAMSGANTAAAPTDDSTALNQVGNDFQKASASFVLSGLTAGSTTFTAVYRTDSGTATFRNRSIWVMPLP